MGKLQKKFGKRIKQLRKSRGLTQESLAEKANLESTYIGAVERGERNLTIDNIEKIAKGFNIEPYKLFISQPKVKVEEPNLTKEQILEILENIPKEKREKLLQILVLCSQV